VGRCGALHRQQRKDALLAMDKPTLKSLCDKLMADAFVKTVMIERLLEREMELSSVQLDIDALRLPPGLTQGAKSERRFLEKCRQP